LKVSLLYYPDDSVQEALAIAREADSLGLYALYVTDFPYRKDVWTLLAAFARETQRIRLGPSAARMLYRDPVLVGQALATLDELSDGRVDAVIGLGGNLGAMGHQLAGQYGTDHPLGRLREVLAVLRMFMSDDRLRFDGEFYRYRYTDLRLSARPLQTHLPIAVGTMGGPQSTRLGGELADGAHIAPAHTRAACGFVVDRIRAGAELAGRDWCQLDIAVAPVWVCSEDRDAAMEVARIQAAFYLPMLAPKLLDAQRIDHAAVKAIADAWRSGDLTTAISMTTPEMVDAIAIAGEPEECAQKLIAHVQDTGINHIVLMVTDPAHTEIISGRRVSGVPSILEQLISMRKTAFPLLGVTD